MRTTYHEGLNPYIVYTTWFTHEGDTWWSEAHFVWAKSFESARWEITSHLKCEHHDAIRMGVAVHKVKDMIHKVGIMKELYP